MVPVALVKLPPSIEYSPSAPLILILVAALIPLTLIAFELIEVLSSTSVCAENEKAFGVVSVGTAPPSSLEEPPPPPPQPLRLIKIKNAIVLVIKNTRVIELLLSWLTCFS
jgi:hypothetical protein